MDPVNLQVVLAFFDGLNYGLVNQRLLNQPLEWNQQFLKELPQYLCHRN